MMNKAEFYNSLRQTLFPKGLTQRQVDGIETIVDTFFELGYEDPRWLAYNLATAYHETATTMAPIIEAQRPKEKPITLARALSRLDAWWRSGKARRMGVRSRYWAPDAQGHSWLGRGYVQLTHKANYKKFAHLLDVDLLNNPELARDPRTAAMILHLGTVEGMFRSGHSLKKYVGSQTDFYRARSSVNGDRNRNGKKIASLAHKFLAALKKAESARAGDPPKPTLTETSGTPLAVPQSLSTKILEDEKFWEAVADFVSKYVKENT